MVYKAVQNSKYQALILTQQVADVIDVVVGPHQVFSYTKGDPNIYIRVLK